MMDMIGALIIEAVILVTCVLPLIKVIQGMREEIKELWDTVSHISGMLHEDEEVLQAMKSNLAVHREMKKE